MKTSIVRKKSPKASSVSGASKNKDLKITTGRRKEASATAWVVPGKGSITVNGLAFNSYFKTSRLQEAVLSPLKLLNVETQYDIKCKVKGGGIKGQAEAVRLAISKALAEFSDSFRAVLRNTVITENISYLTRDSRVVEAKKFGRKKARKQFQFSKR